MPGVFNTAIFYNDFSNQQLAVGLTCVACSAGQSQGVINAGASHMWGIEIEGQIRPFESLRVDFNGGYLATKIDRLQQPGAIPPYDQVSFFSQQGSPLPYASKWKATVTPTYTLPMPDTWGVMEFGLTYIFDSGYTVTIPPQSIYNKSDRLNLFNLNFNWNSIAGSPVDLALFCTNLLDDTYATNYEGTYKQLGWEARLPGQPRFFGGRLKLRFGADAKS